MIRRRRCVLAAFFATALVSARAVAAETRPAFHLAYAPGLATGLSSGFRHQLDAGGGLYLSSRVGNRDGMWSRGEGWLVEGAVMTGFGASPTYAFAEVGVGQDTTLAGLAIVAGPALRVVDEPGGGATARVAADLIAVQLGLRVHAIFVGEADLGASLTIGLGRF